jgi:hypothetical protein
MLSRPSEDLPFVERACFTFESLRLPGAMLLLAASLFQARTPGSVSLEISSLACTVPDWNSVTPSVSKVLSLIF